jgi:bacteriocin biosynthesis cyclodehydratase domain-containing protein
MTPDDRDGDADAALLAMLADPNVRFPERARLIDDVRVFEMPDGLGVQFHFGAAPVIFRGAQSYRALDVLRPLLDGTRTVEQILGECPADLARPTLVKTLVLLHTKGLLAGPEPDPGATDATLRRQLLFWGRNLDTTRAARSADEVQRRLAGYRIALVGTGMFGAATGDLLTRSGCRDLKVLGWDDDGTLTDHLPSAREAVTLPTTAPDQAAAVLRGWVDDVDLVVTATRNAPAALFRAVNRICLQRSRPWLRADSGPAGIEIGPNVQPHSSACFGCLEIRERGMREFPIEDHLEQEDRATERPAGATKPLGEALFGAALGAGLVVGEVVRCATGIAMPALVNTVCTAVPLTGEIRHNTIQRVPRCPECFRGAVPPPIP